MKIVSLTETGKRLAARKAAIGGVPPERVERARNSGRFRTAEKRALLAAVLREAKAKDRGLTFASNF